MHITITPTLLSGVIRVPSSKSMTHRELIAAALAKGETTLSGVTPSQDIEATVRILSLMGAQVEEGEDFLVIKGHSPVLADGKPNPEFVLHGAEVESYFDHRVAMSLACLGLGLKEGQEIKVKDAECCSVSFPEFFEAMNKIGAGFTKA